MSDFVIGIDIQKHLAQVQHRMRLYGNNFSLIICDARYLPFLPNSMDIVIGASVLEHLKEPDLKDTVRGVYEVLNTDGSFVLGYPIESPFVRLFFKSIHFDFHTHHASNDSQIWQAIVALFAPSLKRKRLPFRFLPRFLSFYEVTLATKRHVP
jgi:ubiquinone/menaquinone biosynthesis C-methylase UbiE